MKTITNLFFRGIEVLMVFLILAMFVMVFGNVVLRYGFNSGILISEEASRMAFIWLTFLGAIIGVRNRQHIGMDTVVKRLPIAGKKFCAIASDVFILICCALLVIGGWKQTEINLTVYAPVTEWPMAVIYSAALFSGALIGLIVFINLIRVMLGRVSEEELIGIQETEELAEIAARQKLSR